MKKDLVLSDESRVVPIREERNRIGEPKEKQRRTDPRAKRTQSE